MFDRYIDKVLSLKTKSLKEFVKEGGSKEIFFALRDSKMGDISITKISSNEGACKPQETKHGITAAFGEGISCYISNRDEWFVTSVITRINWKDNTFNTLNSKYSFEFNERDLTKEKDNQVKLKIESNESKSNK